MASAFLLFILFCIILVAQAVRYGFKETSSYKMSKEPKWIAYPKDGKIVYYKTRWGEQ